MRKTFWIIILTFQVLLTYSCHDYEKREEGQHIIHIVKIDPKNFDISIVKAESTNGRETFSSIAKRLNAQIDINGGFLKLIKILVNRVAL